MNIIGYIYKTTCLPENKIYVGKHEASSWDKHYIGSGIAIKPLIKKYGRYNLKCELLEAVDTFERLIEQEKYWIAALHAMDPDIGYNKAIGGNFRSSSFIRIIKGSTIKYIKNKELPKYLKTGWIKVTNSIANRLYRLEHLEELKQKRKIYIAKNREKINSNVRKKRAAHRDEERRKNKIWRDANKKRLNKRAKEYQKSKYWSDLAYRDHKLAAGRRYKDKYIYVHSKN